MDLRAHRAVEQRARAARALRAATGARLPAFRPSRSCRTVRSLAARDQRHEVGGCGSRAARCTPTRSKPACSNSASSAGLGEAQVHVAEAVRAPTPRCAPGDRSRAGVRPGQRCGAPPAARAAAPAHGAAPGSSRRRRSSRRAAAGSRSRPRRSRCSRGPSPSARTRSCSSISGVDVDRRDAELATSASISVEQPVADAEVGVAAARRELQQSAREPFPGAPGQDLLAEGGRDAVEVGARVDLAGDRARPRGRRGRPRTRARCGSRPARPRTRHARRSGGDACRACAVPGAGRRRGRPPSAARGASRPGSGPGSGSP